MAEVSELQAIVGGKSGGGGGGGPGMLLFALAQRRLGRVVLWFAAAFLISSYASTHDGTVLFVSVILALFALFGHFMAARRKRKAKASRRNALMLWGLVLVAIVGALWLVFRRKKKGVQAPPTKAEIDAMILEASATA